MSEFRNNPLVKIYWAVFFFLKWPNLTPDVVKRKAAILTCFCHFLLSFLFTLLDVFAFNLPPWSNLHTCCSFSQSYLSVKTG